MKRSFLILTSLFLLASACNRTNISSEPSKNGSSEQNSSTSTLSTGQGYNNLISSTSKTYSDSVYGFSFQYPSNLNPDVQKFSNSSTHDVEDITLKIGQSAMTISVATPASIKNEEQFCKQNTEGLCYTYAPLHCEQAGQAHCEEYRYAMEGDGSPMKQGYILDPKNQDKIQLNVLISLDQSLLHSDHPVQESDFNDANITQWYRQGKISTDDYAALQVFNQVYSTFQFTK